MSKTYLTSTSLVSPLGWNTEENFGAVEDGRSGIRHVENSPWSQVPVPLSAICENEVDARFHVLGDARRYTHLEKLALLSIAGALEGTEIDPSSPSTVLIASTTKGNVDLLHDRRGFSKDRLLLWQTAGLLAEFFGVKTPPVLVSNACISGVAALLLAHRFIASGRYKDAIVVGVDTLSRFVVSGFQSFMSLSVDACKPFDKDRNGLSLGEASATMIISSRESGIEILSGSLSNDANHISGPSRTGEGLYLSILRTLRNADVEAGSRGARENLPAPHIDLISAHGTATLYNDEMEAIALSRAGLSDVPLNSLKGYFGHTLGAAGLVESIINTEAMKRGVLPGTAGFSKIGVSRSLNVIGTSRKGEIKHMLKLASGFGGCNASMLFRKN